MRLISYSSPVSTTPRLGVRVGHRVLDVESASRVDGEPISPTLKGLLREGRGALSRVRALAKAARTSAGRFSGAMLEEGAIRFWPPLPDSDRVLHIVDGDAGSWKPIEASCLAGHNTRVARAGDGTRCEPRLVFVLGRGTGDFSAEQDPVDYVAGVTLLVAFGSGDGPDLAVIGPELVTLDEVGDPEELWLTCSVNGQEVTRGSPGGRLVGALAQSGQAAAQPGDLLAMACAPALMPGLKAGDTVECSIEGITTLRATLAAG